MDPLNNYRLPQNASDHVIDALNGNGSKHVIVRVADNPTRRKPLYVSPNNSGERAVKQHIRLKQIFLNRLEQQANS